MKLRIEIDVAKCMGQGQCNYWAPATFALGDDGIAYSTLAQPGVENLDTDEAVILGAQGCPTRAIALWRGEERVV